MNVLTIAIIIAISFAACTSPVEPTAEPTPTVAPTSTKLPILSPEQVVGLLSTYFLDGEAPDACVVPFLKDRREVQPVYLGDRLWVFSGEMRSFTVSDETGKILRP